MSEIKEMTFDEWRKRWFETAEERGHKLIRDQDGDVDQFVEGGGFHNGPGCETCGWSTCMHCAADFSRIPVCKSEGSKQK